MGARVEFQRIAGHDLQPARIVRRYLLQCGDRALIALDGDDAPRPLSQQRARQAARPGTDLDDGRALKWAARASDARGQIEIEQEILAEGFFGGQAMPADHLPQWGEWGQ